MEILNLEKLEKFWRGQNLAQLAQNAENRQIKSASNIPNPLCAKLNSRQNFST